MRADYDERGDTIQIELTAVDRLDGDIADIPGVIVGISDGRPVIVDLIGAGSGVADRLRLVGKRFDLDTEALIAAAQAALAAPGRVITLDVALRTAA